MNENEVGDIYKDLKKGIGTEEVAKKYRITRIRVMGYLAAYKRNLKKI